LAHSPTEIALEDVMWLTHQPGGLAILNEGSAIGKLGPRTRNACPVSPNW